MSELENQLFAAAAYERHVRTGQSEEEDSEARQRLADLKKADEKRLSDENARIFINTAKQYEVPTRNLYSQSDHELVGKGWVLRDVGLTRQNDYPLTLDGVIILDDMRVVTFQPSVDRSHLYGALITDGSELESPFAYDTSLLLSGAGINMQHIVPNQPNKAQDA